MKTNWMLYGANGYTGKLIAYEAVKKGLKPILAGRSADKIKSLAAELNLSYRIFDTNALSENSNYLNDISTVLLCAGPFSQTSHIFAAACLKEKTNYLDITGEIPVLEHVLNLDSEAKKSGIIMIPGVGFDVVPTDCLALKLKEALPDATDLELAFAGSATLSPGTMKTIVENLPNGGKIRKDGQIISVPTAYRTRKVSFPFGELQLASIPWGDVCSAYYTTLIPNITVYAPAPKMMVKMSGIFPMMNPILSNSHFQNLLKSLIEKFVPGPNDEQRTKGRMYVWGSVSNGLKSIEKQMRIPEGYTLTMLTALKSVELLGDSKIVPGSYTPAKAFGASFVDEFVV